MLHTISLSLFLKMMDRQRQALRRKHINAFLTIHSVNVSQSVLGRAGIDLRYKPLWHVLSLSCIRWLSGVLASPGTSPSGPGTGACCGSCLSLLGAQRAVLPLSFRQVCLVSKGGVAGTTSGAVCEAASYIEQTSRLILQLRLRSPLASQGQ